MFGSAFAKAMACLPAGRRGEEIKSPQCRLALAGHILYGLFLVRPYLCFSQAEILFGLLCHHDW